MPEQFERNNAFWENNQGVSVPDSLKNAAQTGKINEKNYREAVGLLSEANIPRGIQEVMPKEKLERLKTLLHEADIDEDKIEDILAICENI